MARALQSRPSLSGYRKLVVQAFRCDRQQKGRRRRKHGEALPAPIAKVNGTSPFPDVVRKLARKPCAVKAEPRHRTVRFRGRLARQRESAVAPAGVPRAGKLPVRERDSGGVE